ncbi:MAG: hypothetical protein IJJ99_04865 [Oscillospiraceae bacterium]|nr:hypothetical protein [Oscillospiraceae bacterium]
MKRSGKRVVSACLLLCIALAVSIGLISALTAGVSSAPSENDTYIWVRLPIRADSAVAEIRLYDQNGAPVQTLRTSNGAAVSELLPPGDYFAATELGCTEFTLHEDASVSVSRGCGRSEGKRLCLTSERTGVVTVERFASGPALSEDGGWVDYTLVNETTRLREVVRCTGAQELLTCVFEGVPYGEYVLEENGAAQCRVTIDENTPEVAVSLP